MYVITKKKKNKMKGCKLKKLIFLFLCLIYDIMISMRDIVCHKCELFYQQHIVKSRRRDEKKKKRCMI